MFDQKSEETVLIVVPVSAVEQRGTATLYQDLCYLCGAAPFADRVRLTLDHFGPFADNFQPCRTRVLTAIAELLAKQVVLKLREAVWVHIHIRSNQKSKQLPSITIEPKRYFNVAATGFEQAKEAVMIEMREILQHRHCLYPTEIRTTTELRQGITVLQWEIVFP
ncbi:MAG: hypothetical protein MHM6MM_007696 [Cercozoa sp. M6MM]